VVYTDYVYRLASDVGHVEMANGYFHDQVVREGVKDNSVEAKEDWSGRRKGKSSKPVFKKIKAKKVSSSKPKTARGLMRDYPRIERKNQDSFESRNQDSIEMRYQNSIEMRHQDSSFSPSLDDMNNKHFKKLHQITKNHWNDQHIANEEELKEILKYPEDLLVHDHTVKRQPQGQAERIYESHTIELCVITDPYLFDFIKRTFDLSTDKEVMQKIFKIVHRTLLEAQTILRHNSISVHGGFKIKLIGIRVLKDWGSLTKMSRREKLEDVLFDLGDYLQVVNHKWDGHKLSYDLVVLFTGKMDFKDGDGFAYIGGVCQQDAPVALKIRFRNDKVDLNMGRLLAHEIGHALGAQHDDEYPECKGQNYLMNSVVDSTMNTWSKCSKKNIDMVVSKRTEDGLCFHI